jgi:hypothetical protein
MEASSWAGSHLQLSHTLLGIEGIFTATFFPLYGTGKEADVLNFGGF